MKRTLRLHFIAAVLVAGLFWWKPVTSSSANNRDHCLTIGMPSTTGKSGKEFSDIWKRILADRDHIDLIGIPKSKDNDEQEDELGYCVYSSKSCGAELWGGVKFPGNIGHFRPHYKGKSKVKVCLLSVEEWRLDGVDRGFEGVLSVSWNHDSEAAKNFFADKSNYEKTETGKDKVIFERLALINDEGITGGGHGFLIPNKANGSFQTFEFHCPNYACLPKDIEIPLTMTIQLTAFAESELETFYSVKDYLDSEKYHKVDEYGNQYASKCFCSGSFINDLPNYKGDEFAIIVGHVVEVEEKTNEITGKSFYWALLRTAEDVEIDVVMDKELLQNCEAGPPRVGGVVRGHFWLSGQVVDCAV